jgi:hypothetical protein
VTAEHHADGAGYRGGLVGLDALVDEGGVEVVAGRECNGRSLPAFSANASCSCQRLIRASCCCLVSDEPCLVINRAFPFRDVQLRAQRPRRTSRSLDQIPPTQTHPPLAPPSRSRTPPPPLRRSACARVCSRVRRRGPRPGGPSGSLGLSRDLHLARHVLRCGSWCRSLIL